MNVKQFPKTLYATLDASRVSGLCVTTKKETLAEIGQTLLVGKYQLIDTMKLITLVSEETVTQGD